MGRDRALEACAILRNCVLGLMLLARALSKAQAIVGGHACFAGAPQDTRSVWWGVQQRNELVQSPEMYGGCQPYRPMSLSC
jgi:hypothetical protein